MVVNKKCRLVLFCLLCALFCTAATLKAEEPLKILFIGNSFTLQGPIPDLVRSLAMNAGWTAPDVTNAAVTAKTLTFHTTHIPTLAAIDQGDWDYVVLQEYSTKPTDNIGDPNEFKAAATFLYDRVKESSPDAQIILYETWARHENHSFYPDSFADRDEMQEQLNFHYHDCNDVYIPQNSTADIKTDVRIAPVGEAWHANYHDLNIMLHGDDLYHAGINGKYLSAMAIYSTIYHRMVAGLDPLLGVSDPNAVYLQDICDMVTGETIPQVGDGPVTIADIIDFYDASVAEGDIVGIKKGKISAEEREALFRDILVEAQDLILNEMEACRTLNEAIRACDGVPNPPDYIEGQAVEDLISMIEELMVVLDCN